MTTWVETMEARDAAVEERDAKIFAELMAGYSLKEVGARHRSAIGERHAAAMRRSTSSGIEAYAPLGVAGVRRALIAYVQHEACAGGADATVFAELARLFPRRANRRRQSGDLDPGARIVPALARARKLWAKHFGTKAPAPKTEKSPDWRDRIPELRGGP